MRMDKVFPSKWLKAADLQDAQGRPLTANVVISNVVLEKVAQDKDPMPVVYFQGKSKGLALNKTNCSVIEATYGIESDDWLGQPLQIYPTETTFQGKMVACLRVRIPSQRAATPVRRAAPPPPPSAARMPDDDLPPDFDSDQPADEPEVDGDQIPF